MTFEKFTELVAAEVLRAEQLHPGWPEDIVHAAAILAEEAGEVVKAALQSYYAEAFASDIRTEAIQTAAMCFRLLLNLDNDTREKKATAREKLDAYKMKYDAQFKVWQDSLPGERVGALLVLEKMEKELQRLAREVREEEAR